MVVTPRQFIAGIGIALGIVAAVFLMLPMSATQADPFGGEIVVDCGSPIATSTAAPSDACDDEIGTRRAWSIPLLAVGVLAVVGAAVVHVPTSKSADTPS
jgi:hypothetical protein